MVTNNKMHPRICRESNSSGNQRYKLQSRIQSKAKTQRVSKRMHRAKVAQSCAAQKGANPPKRKVSEQSKDAACEQQNAPRKCSNEDVATKRQVRSRYAREDPSKITANTLLRVQALPGRFPPKTRYKRATRRATLRRARIITLSGTMFFFRVLAKTTMFLSVAPRCSFPWQFLSFSHDVLFRVLVKTMMLFPW